MCQYIIFTVYRKQFAIYSVQTTFSKRNIGAKPTIKAGVLASSLDTSYKVRRLVEHDCRRVKENTTAHRRHPHDLSAKLTCTVSISNNSVVSELVTLVNSNHCMQPRSGNGVFCKDSLSEVFPHVAWLWCDWPSQVLPTQQTKCQGSAWAPQAFRFQETLKAWKSTALQQSS